MTNTIKQKLDNLRVEFQKLEQIEHYKIDLDAACIKRSYMGVPLVHAAIDEEVRVTKKYSTDRLQIAFEHEHKMALIAYAVQCYNEL